MTNIRRNIPRMYAYKFLSEFYLIMPILIPYYRASGLAGSQVFIIQAVYTAGFLLFEIPSGYLADVIGRKKTLFGGAVLMSVGLAVYAISSGFWGFILAELILAYAGSLRSGTDSAMIFESLQECGEAYRYTASQGRTDLSSRIGASGASLLGGFLGLVTFRLPFFINIGTGLMMAGIALTLVEPARSKPQGRNPGKEIFRVIGFCLRHKILRGLMGYWALLLSSGLIGIWSYFLYFQGKGISLGFYGVFYAVFQLTCGFGARFSDVLQKKLGPRAPFWLPLFLSPSFVLLGGFRSLWLIPLICLNGFLWNVSGPALFHLVNAQTDSSVRATVISTVNMAGSLAFVIGGPLFGVITDHFTLSKAYFTLGGAILLAGLPLAIMISRFHVFEKSGARP